MRIATIDTQSFQQVMSPGLGQFTISSCLKWQTILFFIFILVRTALTQDMQTKEKEDKGITSCLFIDVESALRDRSRQRNFQQTIENLLLNSSARFSCSTSSSDLKVGLVYKTDSEPTGIFFSIFFSSPQILP